MDSESEIYIKRARNEINLSKMIMKISEDWKIQAYIL